MTPKIIDKDVKRLITKLNASHAEMFLPVEPEPGAKVGDCFPVVQEKVRRDGGRMIMGWQIWKTKHIVEAECHAVWEDPEGEIHDITPKEGDIDTILFIEDENLLYEEKQIDNIRLNITNNKLVDDLIDVCKAHHKFDNKGDRALLYDLTNVLDEKQKEHRHYILKMKDMINVLLANNGSRKSKCPCNSGIKFKDCHGLNLKDKIRRDI